MDKFFVYGNVSSRDYGVWISGTGTYNKPKRRVQKFSVPGRNGDLTIDEGAFDNVTVTYPAFIAQGFEHLFNNFMAAMYAQTGYQRLEDNYDPDHFRQALFCEAIEPEPGILNRVGSFNLVFDCKPQRWLKKGEEWITDLSYRTTLDARGYARTEVHNPTFYRSKPIIKAYGNGAFYVYDINGGDMWDVSIASYTGAYILIDSDTEDCIGEHNENANEYVTIVDLDLNATSFPELVGGENQIGLKKTGSPLLTSIEILPRWWEI